MSTSPFISPAHPLLTQTVTAVALADLTGDEVQGILERMFEVAQGERSEGKSRRMVGLAAPQIGVAKRIILVDLGVDSERRQLGQLEAYINPQITWRSQESVMGRESCYSVDSCVAGIVPRAERIRIAAYDRWGKQVEQEFAGFTARIFQHEIDHLDGIRFPDRVGKEGVLHWVSAEQFADYPQNWENWPQACPWDVWLAMKEGRSY